MYQSLISVKSLILSHPEQVLARPSALWDGSKRNSFNPFWEWKKYYQRQIQDFPRGAPTYNFDKFSWKLYEIKRILVPRGGPHPSRPP